MKITNMFSSRFEPLIRKYPSHAEALHRVADYVALRESKGKSLSSLQLTPERLRVISNINNNTLLAHLIIVLLSEKIFDRYIVVNSPAGGGIAEFNSIADVPDCIHDTIRDIDMPVTQDNLKTLYRVHELR